MILLSLRLSGLERLLSGLENEDAAARPLHLDPGLDEARELLQEEEDPGWRLGLDGLDKSVVCCCLKASTFHSALANSDEDEQT